MSPLKDTSKSKLSRFGSPSVARLGIHERGTSYLIGNVIEPRTSTFYQWADDPLDPTGDGVARTVSGTGITARKSMMACNAPGQFPTIHEGMFRLPDPGK